MKSNNIKLFAFIHSNIFKQNHKNSVFLLNKQNLYTFIFHNDVFKQKNNQHEKIQKNNWLSFAVRFHHEKWN